MTFILTTDGAKRELLVLLLFLHKMGLISSDLIGFLGEFIELMHVKSSEGRPAGGGSNDAMTSAKRWTFLC